MCRYLFFLQNKEASITVILFIVSRRCGRPVIFIQTQETAGNVRKKLEESEDDEMEVDEPAQKKTKQ